MPAELKTRTGTSALTDGLGGAIRDSLQIAWGKAGMLGDASKHLGTDFVAVVECEDKIWPPVAGERTMRPRLAFGLPPDLE